MTDVDFVVASHSNFLNIYFNFYECNDISREIFKFVAKDKLDFIRDYFHDIENELIKYQAECILKKCECITNMQ